MTYPQLCPICSCPIQLLCASDGNGPVGTIEDAMEAHRERIHPDHEEPA